mmetsp:Transcript_55750/g.178910  ORF Transcript_55750/g.178910 Transcript_55750/m.178910 type:complete len:237 (-) Transcript_55750:108-818(-)
MASHMAAPTTLTLTVLLTSAAVAFGSPTSTLGDETALLQLDATVPHRGRLEHKRACECLPWADVYAKGGLDCMPGLGGLAGQEFCGFITNLHSNVCLQHTFMTPSIVDSYCIVSPQCEGSTSIGGNVPYSYKKCQAGVDQLLVELPIANSTNLALTNGIDQGCLAGYANVYVNKLIREVSKEELAKIKASGVPTFIWSMKDHFADRWEVRGDQVWVHRINPSVKGFWQVWCQEGCP